METTLSLDELGNRLKKTDELMWGVAKRRMDLALQVEKEKRRLAQLSSQEELIRPEVEDRRIQAAVAWAKEHGLNPNFAASLEYMLINESCHAQMMQMQDSQNEEGSTNTGDEEYAQLKKNLKMLTESWAASYDANYDKGNFGTVAYKTLEFEIMRQEIESLPHRGVLLDVGCATGKVALQFCQHFDFTIGYDISMHMCLRAELNSKDVGGRNVDLVRTNFLYADVEKGFVSAKEGDVLADNSVSYVVMNLGTASDIRDIRSVVKEIMRVLMPGGKFFLSFYNIDALPYRWEFIPWQVGLTASINIYKHCLEVRNPGTGRQMPIYARPYTTTEVREILAESKDLRLVTYPALSAILPSVLFENQPEIQEAITALDRSQLDSNMGAYIIAMGTKG